MELRHLRYFIAVAEEENVTRAASRLHVSQPGLSRQIRDLEDEIGFQLLERTAKSVRLTDAGRAFLVEARKVLQAADNAVKIGRAKAGGLQSELCVGYAPSLTVQILPAALRKFQAEFPKVRVVLLDLSSEEMLEKLHRGKLHVALTIKLPRKLLRGLRFTELAKYPVCVAVARGHHLARARSLKAADLAGESLITYNRTEYPEAAGMFDTIFKRGERKPRVAEEHDSVTSLIAAVEAGRGIAIVPSSFACMAGPRLKVIPLISPSEPIVVGAIVRDHGTVPEYVEKFIAAARG